MGRKRVVGLEAWLGVETRGPVAGARKRDLEILNGSRRGAGGVNGVPVGPGGSRSMAESRDAWLGSKTGLGDSKRVLVGL